MKDTWISFLHSYQYVPNYKNLLIDNDILIDNTGKKILGLKNVPKNSEVYKLVFDSIYPKKKSHKYNLMSLASIRHETNLKIMVKVNINILENKVFNGEFIPNRPELFKLLRRNVRNYINYNESILNYINIKTFNNIFETKIDFNNRLLYNFQIELYNWLLEKEYGTYIKFLNSNIIKISKLYIDCELERFYNTTNNLMENNIFLKGGIILDDYSTLYRNTISYLICNVFNKKKFSIKDNYLDTNASLVICNTNNLDKWKSNFINKGKKCIIITSKIHLEKYSYSEIFSSDIVIISINILNNQSYLKNWEQYQSNGQNIEEAFETILYEKIRNPKLQNLKNVIFQLFNWKRIIYDEIIEYNKTKVISEMIKLFKSDIKWVLQNYNTNIETLINCYKLITNNSIKFNLDILYKFSSISLRTKLNLNKLIKYENISLEFNAIENQLYKLIKNKELFLSLPYNIMKINSISYSSLKESSKKKNILDIKIKNKDICSICLQKLSKNDIGITKCNHVFCYTCVYNNLFHSNTCPNCRSELEVQKINFSNNNDQYCSKLVKLLNMLNKFQKTIILSKYEETLININNILELKSKNVFFHNSNSKLSYKFNKTKKGVLLVNINYLETIPFLDNINEIIFVEYKYDNKEYLLDKLISSITNYNYKNIKFNRLFYSKK